MDKINIKKKLLIIIKPTMTRVESCYKSATKTAIVKNFLPYIEYLGDFINIGKYANTLKNTFNQTSCTNQESD